MMSLAHKYEDFGNKLGFSSDMLSLSKDDAESVKLKAFEDGYEAGWEDSVSEQKKSRKEISSSMAKNLQEASLSYEEARDTLTQALRPLFEAILDKFLPAIGKSTMLPLIAEQLSHMAQNQTDQPVQIVVSSKDFESLESVLEGMISVPFTLVKQSGQVEGQISIRVGAIEREINFENMINEVRSSIISLFE